MRLPIIPAVLILASLPLVVLAAPRQKDDWEPGHMLKTLVKEAAEKDRAIVILYQFQQTGCPLHEAKVAAFERTASLRSMLRVRAYAEKHAKLVNKFRRMTVGNVIPVLIFTDGEDHLIAYVPNAGRPADVSKMVALANSTMRWKKGARKRLETVEEQVSQAKYAQAWSELDKIETEDRTRTGRTDWEIKTLCKRLVDRPEKKEGQEQEDPDAELWKAIDEMPRTPQPAEQGMFFQQTVDSQRMAIREAVEDVVILAEIALVNAKPDEAKAKIAPVLDFTGDEDLTRRIADVNAKLGGAADPSGDSDDPPPKPPVGTPDPEADGS